MDQLRRAGRSVKWNISWGLSGKIQIMGHPWPSRGDHSNKKIKGEREKKSKKWGFSGIKGTVREHAQVFEVIFGHCPMILIL